MKISEIRELDDVELGILQTKIQSVVNERNCDRRIVESRKLLGKCFRSNNGMLGRVVGVDDSTGLPMFACLQTRGLEKHERVEFQFPSLFFAMETEQEISLTEFLSEINLAIKKIRKSLKVQQ